MKHIMRGIILLAILTGLLTNKSATAQDKIQYICGLHTSIANVSWENLWADDFDNLGTGIFYSPYLKIMYGKFNSHTSLTKSDFDFTGPDGLTVTGPDDDLDAGLDTEMKRNDIEVSFGYQVFSVTNIFLTMKHFKMRLKGTAHSGSMWSKMDYLEKGMLFGGGIENNVSFGKSGLYSTFSASYLTGTLVADYTFGTDNNVRKMFFNGEDINTIIRCFKLGLGYKLTHHVITEFSYLYEYYSKENESDVSIYLSNDNCYQGLNFHISYLF